MSDHPPFGADTLIIPFRIVRPVPSREPAVDQPRPNAPPEPANKE